MNGPGHYRKAEQLAAEAEKLLGQGDGQSTAAAWAAAAQVHATLALAAATALGVNLPHYDRESGAEEVSVVQNLDKGQPPGDPEVRPARRPRPPGQSGPPPGSTGPVSS